MGLTNTALSTIQYVNMNASECAFLNNNKEKFNTVIGRIKYIDFFKKDITVNGSATVIDTVQIGLIDEENEIVIISSSKSNSAIVAILNCLLSISAEDSDNVLSLMINRNAKGFATTRVQFVSNGKVVLWKHDFADMPKGSDVLDAKGNPVMIQNKKVRDMSVVEAWVERAIHEIRDTLGAYGKLTDFLSANTNNPTFTDSSDAPF